MELITGWIVLSIVAGVIASNKGRSGFGFFLLALLLSPVIGIICAAVAAKDQKEVEKQMLSTGDTKKCPKCAEIIKKEALKCRYCGSELT